MTIQPSTYPLDLKHHVPDNETGAPTSRPTSRRRPFALAFAAVALCYFVFTAVTRPELFRHCGGLSRELSISPAEVWVQTEDERPLVPLEAHIMSKCPDAQDCLKKLILPTMQRVFDKVNFTLSYIGTPTNNDGVECKHGPEECMGNIIELCAAKLYPDPKIYLGFTMCLTREYHDIPQQSLVEDCALEHGINIDSLDNCATEEDGGTAMGMLRDSVRRSIDAGVTKSCTVRLNEEIYCVRDGGKWKDCPHGSEVNDLVIAVEKAYRASPSEARRSPSIAR